MKTKIFSVTTIIILVIALLCTGICAWQTVLMLSHQTAFAADHPDYIPHSWYLLALVAALAVLAGGELVLRRKGNPVLCGALSVLMLVLEVLALGAAADQHYNLGMLVSDYGIRIPFEGGWVLLILAVAILIATAVQLLTVIISVMTGKGSAA